MATTKPRFSITLDEEMFKKVNDYQHRKHYATQTKAIVDLIQRGAESLGLSIPDVIENEEVSFSSHEIEIIKKYRALDEHGKRIVDLVLDEESERMNEEDSEYMYAAARGGGLVKIPKPDAEVELPEKDSFIDGL